MSINSHEGAVWSVAWAHPKYGNILASAGYDGKVFIWREQSGTWQRIFDFALHKASVNIVSWAPHEAGCLLACASSDGNVSVLDFKDNGMNHVIFPAHGLGVNSVSWAPAASPGSIVSSNPGPGAAANRRRQPQRTRTGPHICPIRHCTPVSDLPQPCRLGTALDVPRRLSAARLRLGLCNKGGVYRNEPQ